MKINSLIETIKRSIVTGTSADVKITDKSFIAELLGKDEEGKEDAHKTPSLLYVPRFNVNRRFPVSHYILQCFWSAITLLIAAFYYVPSKVLQAFTGRKRDLRLSARFNAILFISCITSFIVILAFSVTFLLKSVLFFDADSRINSQGAIIMKQPLGVEKYVYLFNTATPWANTGIELLENDIVEVSASGSFYGKIADLCEKATSNDTLSYQWNKPILRNDGISITRLCVYKGSDAYFGSLLFQICPESNRLSFSSDNDSTLTRDKEADKLRSIKNEMIQFGSTDGEKFSFTAHLSGTLFLAVNDIYLDEGTLSVIERDKHNAEIQKLLNGKSTALLRTIAKDRSTLWFEDNIGEILLNVTVYRDAVTDNNSEIIPDAFPKMYRGMENMFNNGISGSCLLVLFCFAIFIAADYVLGKLLRRKK